MPSIPHICIDQIQSAIKFHPVRSTEILYHSVLRQNSIDVTRAQGLNLRKVQAEGSAKARLMKQRKQVRDRVMQYTAEAC